MTAYVVEKSAIRNNLKIIQKRAEEATVWAVLKGNAYGLGLLPMAELCRECGVTHFAVTELDDAEALRKGGFEKEEILLLQPTADADLIRKLLALNVIATVSSQDDATMLNGIAVSLNTVAEAHVKIDVGMGRYGFFPEELEKILPIYAYMDGIAVSGIYAHLSCAFCSKKITRKQLDRFHGVINAIQDAGYESGVPHVLNSEGLLRFPEYRLGGVRVGSAILGRLNVQGNRDFERVGVCETNIIELRWLPKGSTCGYGAGWKAKKPTRIAVVPVGWYHGFGCEMGNDLVRLRDRVRAVCSALLRLIVPRRYTVTVGGKPCRVLGHIGMLHTVVDVTDVTCSLGDKVQMQINPIMIKGMNVIFK